MVTTTDVIEIAGTTLSLMWAGHYLMSAAITYPSCHSRDVYQAREEIETMMSHSQDMIYKGTTIEGTLFTERWEITNDASEF